MAEYNRDCTSCQDEHRNSRTNEMTTTGMVQEIHEMVLKQRRLKVHELADMVGISKGAVHCILTENLDMRKLCTRWMPGLLTIKQKKRREYVSTECFVMFHSNKADFSRRFIIMDETWVYHFTPEMKKQSKQLTES